MLWVEKLTVSKFFNHIDNSIEQQLYDDITVENIQMTGVDIYYMPREVIEFDPVLGEPTGTSFTDAYVIEMYIDQEHGGTGPGDFLSQMGVMTDELFTLSVSRRRFAELKIPDRVFPISGDIIYAGLPEKNMGYSTYINGFYEITKVDNEVPFWPLGQHYVYQLTVKKFIYSYEKFNTGIAALDQYQPLVTNEIEIERAINRVISPGLIDSTEKNPFGGL